MTINEFAAEVHKNAVEHGWWEGERTFPEIVALIHSEVSEALEEYRDGKPQQAGFKVSKPFAQRTRSSICGAGS